MKIWFWPIVIGLLSLAGLIVGLIYDDLGDVFALKTELARFPFSIR